jgi:hypothetical protein
MFYCVVSSTKHMCVVSRVHFVSRPVSRCIPCAEQGVLYERVVLLLTERANHSPLCGLVCSLALPLWTASKLQGRVKKVIMMQSDCPILAVLLAPEKNFCP